jgi:putative hydrolase of HD superfamily
MSENDNEAKSSKRQKIADATSTNSDAAAASALEFARLLGNLKTTPRTGWVRRGVPKYESVADHSWRVAALSLLLPRDKLNVPKCMELAIVHDMAESLVGDIAPDDNVSKEEKQTLESNAMKQIASILAKATTTTTTSSEDEKKNNPSKHLLELFHEYEERKTQEAVAVKDLDLLDMILQADTYEQTFDDMDLSDFFEGTPVDRFRTPAVKRLAQQVHAERTERKSKLSTEASNSTTSSLSGSDKAFVAEYSKVASLSPEAVQEVVRALRNWDKDDSNSSK